MNGLSIADRQNMGNEYMRLAIKYGHIKLKEGLSLYTAAGLETEGLNRDNIKLFFPEGIYFFKEGKTIFECTDPLQVIDCLEDETVAYGQTVPVNYKSI